MSSGPSSSLAHPRNSRTRRTWSIRGCTRILPLVNALAEDPASHESALVRAVRRGVILAAVLAFSGSVVALVQGRVSLEELALCAILEAIVGLSAIPFAFLGAWWKASRRRIPAVAVVAATFGLTALLVFLLILEGVYAQGAIRGRSIAAGLEALGAFFKKEHGCDYAVELGILLAWPVVPVSAARVGGKGLIAQISLAAGFSIGLEFLDEIAHIDTGRPFHGAGALIVTWPLLVLAYELSDLGERRIALAMRRA